MKYRLAFQEGSLKGMTVDVVLGRDVSIGRSRSCDVRPKEEDVSGHHATVSLGADGSLRMKVLSQHETVLNAAKLASGATVEVKPRDVVRFGNACTFVVEAFEPISDDPPTIAGETLAEPATQIDASTGFVGLSRGIDAEKTRATSGIHVAGAAEAGTAAGFTVATRIAGGGAEAPSQAPGDGETVFLRTMAGSDEDMIRIKREFQIRRRNRFLAWGVPAALAFAGIVAAYVALKPVPEEFVTWPKDEKGEFLNRFSLVEPFIAVCVPDVPAFSETKGESLIHIQSAVGRDRDVPLFVDVEKSSDVALLRKDHRQAFNGYISHRREVDASFAPEENAISRFICTDVGAGVPITYTSYTRRKGADEFFGYLVYLRQADKSYAFSIEVPLSAKWRAEALLLSNLTSIVLYAPKKVPSHWEGSSAIRVETSVAEDLEAAKGCIIRNPAPQKWDKGYCYLLSALVKATELAASGKDAGREDESARVVSEATDMLVKLRERQSDWFNMHKLGYLRAEIANNKDGMKLIEDTCKSAFTDIFKDCDYRYDSIMRKEWR